MPSNIILKSCIYWFILPLVILFILGNIVLNSRQVKAIIEHNLTSKTGVEFHIETVNVGPTGVIHIYDISAALGDGGIEVKHAAVTLNYFDFFRKKLRFKEIYIDEPKITLTDTWILKQFNNSTKLESKKNFIAQLNSKSEGKVKLSQNRKQKVLNGALTALENSAIANNIGDELRKIKIDSGSSQQNIQKLKRGDSDQSWIRLRNTDLNIITKLGKFMHIRAVNLDLPVGASDIAGGFSWEQVSMFGREIFAMGNLKIGKNGRILSLKETKVDFFGVVMKLEVQLAFVAGRILYYLDINIPEQQVDQQLSHLGLNTQISLSQFSGRLKMLGDLKQPSRWRGIVHLESKAVNITEGHRNATERFNSFLLQSYINKSVIFMPRASLKGDEFSIMSNAIMQINGNGYGIVRIVALQESKNRLDRLVNGSRLFYGMRGSLLTPLGTEDVYYTDLKLDGNVINPMVEVDGRVRKQSLWQAIKRLNAFIKKERQEGF